jgi:molybdopterin synthase sulfur carrier subunit
LPTFVICDNLDSPQSPLRTPSFKNHSFALLATFAVNAADKMLINIRAFGIAKEICGGSVFSLEIPERATAEQVKQLILEQFPRFGQLASFVLAVNEEYAEPDTPVASGDEIALIPPVSGG